MRDSSNFHRADEESFWTSAKIQKKYRKTRAASDMLHEENSPEHKETQVYADGQISAPTPLHTLTTSWLWFWRFTSSPRSLVSLLSLYSQKHARITNQISADINKGHKM